MEKSSMLTFHEIESNIYDEDYYERGVQTGKSGYQNYSWMPELTLRMAHHLITELDIQKNYKVLDFGCAKGYLVKALRLLSIDAYGIDASKYAIDCVDVALRNYCQLVKADEKPNLPFDQLDLIIAKDVFEHIPENQLSGLLSYFSKHSKKLFMAVPLAHSGTSNFIVPQYHNDVTHITIKDKDWWLNMASTNGWKISLVTNNFVGLKENWTQKYKDGNLFALFERS